MAKSDIDKIVGAARDQYIVQREREKQQQTQKSQAPVSGIGGIVESARDSYIKQSQNPYAGPRRVETPVLMARQKSVIDWADRYDKATKGFFDYDKKRNGRYTADASGGFGGEIDALIKDFDKISEYAGQYGLYYPGEYVKQLRDIQKYVGDNNSFYSQFADENEYNTWDTDQKKKKKAREDMLAFDTAAGRVEIDGLKSEYDSLKSKRLTLSNAYNDSFDEKEQASIGAQIREIDSKMSGMKDSISQKERYLYTAQHEQKYNLSGNSDFGVFSRYEDSEELKGWEKLLSQYGIGYEDATYEYINDQDGARKKILDRSRAYGSSQGSDNSPFVELYAFCTLIIAIIALVLDCTNRNK